MNNLNRLPIALFLLITAAGNASAQTTQTSFCQVCYAESLTEDDRQGCGWCYWSAEHRLDEVVDNATPEMCRAFHEDVIAKMRPGARLVFKGVEQDIYNACIVQGTNGGIYFRLAPENPILDVDKLVAKIKAAAKAYEKGCEAVKAIGRGEGCNNLITELEALVDQLESSHPEFDIDTLLRAIGINEIIIPMSHEPRPPEGPNLAEGVAVTAGTGVIGAGVGTVVGFTTKATVLVSSSVGGVIGLAVGGAVVVVWAIHDHVVANRMEEARLNAAASLRPPSE